MIRRVVVSISICMAVFSLANGANAAILVEEAGQSLYSASETKISSDVLDFRSHRRVGFGWAAAGALGLLGLQLELNFTPDVSVVGGFGISRGFQAFSFQVKRVLAGKWFAPYVAGGFARWYNVGHNGAMVDSSPDFLSQRFLSETERQTGQFGENMIFPSAGIQYLQLSGDWAGASLYAEVMMMIDMDDFVAAPTAGLGMMYYF
ncbi:MAG: hypothetical protein H6626_12320 [Pseudobdellovibrionaceae bacterium]|nr:MAG: hypothetical protein H6626_12320 [Pseudobdellovibrionaceae bacterium]